MPWKEVKIERWQDFTETAANISEALPVFAYLCRGQADNRWKLQPSLLRCFRTPPTRAQLVEVEIAAIEVFKRAAHSYLSTHQLSITKKSAEWWTIMQQYGAPTRLLDWTSSPYVALYFAISAEPEADGAVWLVSNVEMNNAMGNTADFFDPQNGIDLDDYFLRNTQEPRLHTEKPDWPVDRMQAQQGLYTICTDPTIDHGDLIDKKLGGKSGLRYTKLVIPKESKGIFLLHLREMNITASSMFPGIDGIGRSIAEVIKITLRQ